MSDFIFFAKLFCLTVALVIAMQIQVGDRSVEAHAMEWVQSSTLTTPLNTVAHGGAKMVHDVVNQVHAAIDHNVGKKKKEDKSSSSSFHWTHIRPKTDSESKTSGND